MSVLRPPVAALVARQRQQPTGHVGDLLAAIRRLGGPWTERRAVGLYLRLPSTRDIPPGKLRTVARGDLRDLAAWGWLNRHEKPGRPYFTLNTRKDVRP